MVDEDPDNLVPILESLWLASFFDLNKLPDIILWDVIRGVGTAGYLVVQFAVRMLDLVSVKVVFCFEIAEDYRICQDMKLSIAVDFVQ